MAKVLIACECSGTVRDAFDAEGHDAWSCDLNPSTRPTNRGNSGTTRMEKTTSVRGRASGYVVCLISRPQAPSTDQPPGHLSTTPGPVLTVAPSVPSPSPAWRGRWPANGDRSNPR